MTELSEIGEARRLELASVVGFNGNVPHGLIMHPDQKHLLYPLGCTVIIKDMDTEKPTILWGHTHNVSCLTLSKSGKYIASGQVTHMGFKADIIIWDFESRSLYCRLSLHMVKVQALAFSPNDKYLVSLGGEDDGSVVVWNIAKKEAICGSPAQVKIAGTTYTVTYANNREDMFVTGGNGSLRVWELDVENRKIRAHDVNMGQLKRVITCIKIDDNDNFFYCGTTTGDILGINANTRLFQFTVPEKDKFSMGITTLRPLASGELMVGTGDGSLCLVQAQKQKFKVTSKVQKLHGAVTSIAWRGSSKQCFVATQRSHIYRFDVADLSHQLISTSHCSPVNDIAFPHGLSDLFATASYQEIRVWHLPTAKELLRIVVPNMTCNTLEITKDGKSIVSGWDDGRIRAFYPESGKAMYTIEDAAKLSVTALTTSNDCNHIISGGGDGQVRVWTIKVSQTPNGNTFLTELTHGMKEHRASITCIKISKNDMQCVTSSIDGTCIIWDLLKAKRLQMLRANTLFKFVCFHPNECQIITSGTDRKIGYWETFDGSMIRELEGSTSGSVNGMDITSDGSCFVTGGDDQLIKVWKYDEGEVTHVGLGHSGPITRVKVCPCSKYISSISSDGAVLSWHFPK